MPEITRLEIDEEGKIFLPDNLLRRLCLKNSCSVPLFETNLSAYVMPSAISAIFMASSYANDEFKDDKNNEELTEEELERICFEYRYGNQKRHKFSQKEMKYHMILCPLEDGKMTLPPEVMEKLQIKPGDEVAVVKKNGILFLCGSNVNDEKLVCAAGDLKTVFLN